MHTDADADAHGHGHVHGYVHGRDRKGAGPGTDTDIGEGMRTKLWTGTRIRTERRIWTLTRNKHVYGQEHGQGQ
jgi:hypothetical protein